MWLLCVMCECVDVVVGMFSCVLCVKHAQTVVVSCHVCCCVGVV